MLSIAAQLLKSGWQVLVLNLASFLWSEIEKIINAIHADLVGISCVTRCLPGIKALSQLIRQRHPQACIVVGGPHVTPLPAETLNHQESIDIVVIGEGENTFLEIVERLEADASQPPQGVTGTVWRGQESVQFAPPRERIKNLDSLASPHDYFYSPILLTTRGCPSRCTFCGSFSQWGKNLVMNSPNYILRLWEKIVMERGEKFLSIKDDTFTANKQRILAVCHQIITKKLNFIWSCDTRADSLDEEILRTRCLAGCRRISLGGSQARLPYCKPLKNIYPRKAVEVSHLARKYGIQVRFYMIIGNRGETLETIQQSFELIHEAHPFSANFNPLEFIPGTDGFETLKKEKGLGNEIFYREDYRKFLKNYSYLPEKKSGDYIKLFMIVYGDSINLNYSSTHEYIEILHRLDGHHSAHMNLAGAYLRAGEPEQALPHIFMAIDKKYPHMEISLNHLAIVSTFQGDYSLAENHLFQASKITSDLRFVFNYLKFKPWRDFGGLENGNKLTLKVISDYACYYWRKQPDYPASIRLPD
ncbi:MAG: cobalamin-dependent protein [Magnetococcales bacterium]|nr:cobalamin-dependent protein [Magnetococcales bacterium]